MAVEAVCRNLGLNFHGLSDGTFVCDYPRGLDVPTKEPLEILLGFIGDENDYVQALAAPGFARVLEVTEDVDCAIDMSIKALMAAKLDVDPRSEKSQSRRIRWALGHAIDRALGEETMDIATIRKAVDAFKPLAMSEDKKLAYVGLTAVANVANVSTYRGYDDEAVERSVDEMRARIEDALSYFPDNKR